MNPPDTLPTVYLEQIAPRLPAHTRALLLTAHLEQICPDCRGSLPILADEISREPSPEHLATLLFDTEPPSSELDQALTDADALLALPEEERRPVLSRSISRYRSPVLVAVLLVRCREALPDVDRAAELARLAHHVAHHLGDLALSALALASEANAYRSAGRLADADRLFQRAGERLPSAPETSLWLRAEFESLLGSLRKDQRDLRAATTHLRNARGMFRACGDSERQVRTEMNLASTLRLAGDLPAALAAIEDTLMSIDPLKMPYLHLIALHSLTLYLAMSGEAYVAKHLLVLLDPLYAPFPSVATRRSWLTGVIEREMGNTADAETLLRLAIQEFLDRESPMDAGLVALDLAELLLAEGRGSEVKAITRDLPALFRQLDVHPEAALGVLLFHRAARQDRVSQRYVDHLRELLHRSDLHQPV